MGQWAFSPQSLVFGWALGRVFDIKVIVRITGRDHAIPRLLLATT